MWIGQFCRSEEEFCCTFAQASWGTKTRASGAPGAITTQVHVRAQIQNGSTASGTALTLQTAADTAGDGITVRANGSCALTQTNWTQRYSLFSLCSKNVRGDRRWTREIKSPYCRKPLCDCHIQRHLVFGVRHLQFERGYGLTAPSGLWFGEQIS